MTASDAFVPSLSDLHDGWDYDDGAVMNQDEVPSVTYDRTVGLDPLLDLYLEAREHNWDGEGADAISSSVVEQACRFFLALPVGDPEPEFDTTPRGTILFTWYAAPRRRLSVEINARGDLAFAAMLGHERTQGTTLFVGSVPRIIRRLASQVMA